MLQQTLTITLVCFASQMFLKGDALPPRQQSVARYQGEREEAVAQDEPGLASVGASYTRWGSTTCPATQGTQLVYEGITVGSRWTEAGSSNYLCLHRQPEFLSVTAGSQKDGRGYLYATEYDARDDPPSFGAKRGQDVPCSVCYTSGRSSTITIPGRTSCPPSWTREYYGYLMSEHSNHPKSGRAPICVDENGESIVNSASSLAQSVLYHMEVRCSGLCPPYSNGVEVTCVVCSK